MNFRKIKEIVKFSLQKSIQNKWFVLLNVIIMISTVAIANVNNIKEFMKNNNIDLFDEELTIEIIDEKNLAKDLLVKEFEKNENIEFVEPTQTEYTKENIPDDYIIIEVDESDEYIITSKIISKEGLDNAVYSKITNSLKEARSKQFANKLNIEIDRLKILNEEPNIERIMLGVDSENSDTKEIIKTVSTFGIYFVSIFIFSAIANEIAQEKVSKSIEYVLTSVSAKEYLLAKIISVIGLVIIQGVYCFVYYMMGNLVNNLINMDSLNEISNMSATAMFGAIDKDIMLYVITVLGYGILTLILMSIIQAALSSKTTNMSEAGNTVSFLMTLTIVMYFVTLFVITPYTKVSTILYVISCIPLVSNYFIPAMMIIGQVTPVQIVVSLILLIVSIPVAFKICSKIFKNGVLDYKENKKKVKEKKEKSFEEIEKQKLTMATFRKIAFGLGSVIIFWVAAQMICSLVLGVAGISLLSKILTETQISLIILGATSIISIMIPVIFISMYIEDSYKVEKKKISVKSIAGIIVVSVLIIGLLQIGMSYLYPHIGLDYNIIENISFNKDEGFLTGILYFVCIAVIPGVFEELLFRKCIIDYTRKIGNGFALIVSAIAFGAVHLNLGQGIFAFCLGILFGIIYLKTGSIRTTMIIHFLNNGFAALCVIFAEQETIIFICAIAIMFIGFIALVKYLIENKDKIKNIKLSKPDIAKYKYMFCDYTFIVMIVLTVLLFVSTENMLRL